jgi:hypothetical protein
VSTTRERAPACSAAESLHCAPEDGAPRGRRPPAHSERGRRRARKLLSEDGGGPAGRLRNGVEPEELAVARSVRVELEVMPPPVFRQRRVCTAPPEDGAVEGHG